MILPARLLEPALLGTSWPAIVPEADHARAISLGHPGRCSGYPTLLSLLFDDSGSITAPGGNDPIGNRFVEALLAIEAVAKRCRCRRELVSVIHFDVPTAADLAPTPLRAHRGQIGRALQLPRNARGNSLLRPSLKEAHRIAEQLPSHRHVLCVLSDFQLFDDKLDELLDEFAAFPGDVHAVVLRADPPAQLVDDVRVTVTPIGYDDPPGALARAVFAAATTHRLPSRGGR